MNKFETDDLKMAKDLPADFIAKLKEEVSTLSDEELDAMRNDQIGKFLSQAQSAITMLPEDIENAIKTGNEKTVLELQEKGVRIQALYEEWLKLQK